MKVEYHPAIEAELQAIRSFYENQSPGLGRQFVDETHPILRACFRSPARPRDDPS
jgi:hypothetical protein